MGKVLQSVKEVMQGTLHLKKPDTMVSAGTNGKDTHLSDAMDEFERIVVEGIGRLKAAITEDQALAASGALQAEQVIEDLKANIASLEAKLKEAEETARGKDLASQQTEERLNTAIRDLQAAAKTNEEALQNRDAEVNDLKSKMDAMAEQVRHLELAIQQTQGEAAAKTQQAEQVIEGLKGSAAMLEAKLKEAEEAAHGKDVTRQQAEERLNAEIRGLQGALKKKEEALEGRDAEIKDLKSKMAVLTEQVNHLESAIQQTQGEAAGKAQQAEQVIEALKTNIAALETKLKEAEETTRGKDLASQQTEERLNAEIRDLQSAVKTKDEALQSRDAEVNDLKSKMDAMAEQVNHLESAIEQTQGEAAAKTQQAEQVIEGLKAKIVQQTETERIVSVSDRGIEALAQERAREATDLNGESKPQTTELAEVFSFFNKAEALADRQAQEIGTVVPTGQSKAVDEKPRAVRETVSREVFSRMVAEFSALANVIENIASLIVRDHVRVLGESVEEFPKRRFTQLVESLSKEMSDEKLKADFRRRFNKV